MLMAVGKRRHSFAYDTWLGGFHRAFTTGKVVCDGNLPHRAFSLDHPQRPVCRLASVGLSTCKELPPITESLASADDINLHVNKARSGLVSGVGGTVPGPTQ